MCKFISLAILVNFAYISSVPHWQMLHRCSSTTGTAELKTQVKKVCLNYIVHPQGTHDSILFFRLDWFNVQYVIMEITLLLKCKARMEATYEHQAQQHSENLWASHNCSDVLGY